MAGIKGYKEFPYKLPEDAGTWTFRQFRHQKDIDTVTDLTQRQMVDGLDRKQLKKLMIEGGDVDGYLEEHTGVELVYSTQVAMLGVMSVSHDEGDFFDVPEDVCRQYGLNAKWSQPADYRMRDSNRKQYRTDLKNFLKYVDLVDPDELQEIYNFMSLIWMGGDPEKVAQFQGQPSPVDEPVLEDGAERGKRVSRGDR